MEIQERTLFTPKKLEITLQRLVINLIENYGTFENAAMIAIQPRGVYVGRRLLKHVTNLQPETKLDYGELDVTFYRDDFRRSNSLLRANNTSIKFLVEGRRIILVDDVLYTGRTVRAALDAMLAYGRPDQVELLTLVDRNGKREVPIEAAYTGIKVDTMDEEKVIVRLKEYYDDQPDEAPAGTGTAQQDSIRIEKRK